MSVPIQGHKAKGNPITYEEGEKKIETHIINQGIFQSPEISRQKIAQTVYAFMQTP